MCDERKKRWREDGRNGWEEMTKRTRKTDESTIATENDGLQTS